MEKSKGLVGHSTLTKRRWWAVNLEGAKIKTYKNPKPDKMSEKNSDGRTSECDSDDANKQKIKSKMNKKKHCLRKWQNSFRRWKLNKSGLGGKYWTRSGKILQINYRWPLTDSCHSAWEIHVTHQSHCLTFRAFPRCLHQCSEHQIDQLMVPQMSL